MREQKNIVPEGLGFEQDYDKYNTNPDRQYENADIWWKNYCLLGKEELEKCPFKNELLSILKNDIYLAMVVNHFVGKNYKTWIDKDDINNLGGLTPRQCLNSDYGTKRLRMLFLMMH